MPAITSSIEFWSAGGSAGYRVVWFNDETEREAHWYADTRAEAEVRSTGKPPAEKFWFKNNVNAGTDAATLTGMYDHD